LSQRRSYSNSNDFNLDDLFRPEPGAQPPAQQQTAPPEQFQGGPEYLGAPPPQQAPQHQGQQQAPQAEAAPETQYLPPYPTGDPAAGGGVPQQQPMSSQPSYGGQSFPGHPPQPPQQPGYGAQQTFGGQTFGGQTFGGQQQFGAPQQSYGAPAQGFPPAPPAYAPADQGYASGGEGGGRPNNKLIIGGVIAGVAAAGILIAVLASGGDSGGGKAPTAGKTGTSAPATAGTGTAVSPELQAQAKAVSDLISTANSSRQAVIGAVSSVRRCDKLPESQQALTDAAAKRDQLVTGLAGLKVDKLPSGPQLVEQLQKAWQASATADREYAGWAGDSIAGCDPTKKDNPHLKAGDEASGTATMAKNQASTLWNAIAAQTGLPTKGSTEL